MCLIAVGFSSGETAGAATCRALGQRHQLRRRDLFHFADLLIPPILNIYRKYYGGRVALYLAVVSYLAMAAAGFLISLAFKALGWVPARHPFNFAEAAPTWNYTTVLNLVFLVLVAVLVIRFLRTGGVQMLRMMDSAPSSAEGEMSSAHSQMSMPRRYHPRISALGNGYG